MQTWTIESPLVAAQIHSLGGMVGPARFKLGPRTVSPLAVAPWAGEPEAATLPPILQSLRGEWPCVPFGIASGANLPPEWRPEHNLEPDTFAHGYSSNGFWQAVSHTASSVELKLVYPEAHPIACVRRRVTAAADRPALEFTLWIEARAACRLPIGIHPTFRLPGTPGSNKLEVDPERDCWTPPISAEPGISRMAIDRRGVGLDAVPLADGRQVDFTRLPLADPAEELLLVVGARGRSRLSCASEGYSAEVRWDPAVFASLMLWISNRGRTMYPWSGRHLALGMEPVTAAFDLGTSVSANRNNPLEKAGHATARDFAAGEILETRYSIEVASLD